MLIAWQAFDEQPMFPDNAFHWLRAHWIRDALARGGPGLMAPLQGYYPPLFSSALGVLEFVLPYPWPLIALHAGGMLLAAACYYRIYSRSGRPEYGQWSFGILLAAPLMVWSSHEALIDVLLTFWVLGSLTLLLATDDFAARAHSLWLGLAMGLGFLVKWTFAAFFFFPVAWTLVRIIRSPERAQRFGHAHSRWRAGVVDRATVVSLELDPAAPGRGRNG